MARGFGFPSFPATAAGDYLAASYVASLSAAAPPPEPAEFVSFTTAAPNVVEATPMVINRPSGAQSGDLMVLGIRGQANANISHFSHADWQMITNAYPMADTNRRVSEIFIRRIADIGSEASSYTFNKPTGFSGNRVVGLCVLLRNIDPDTDVIGGFDLDPTTSLTYAGHAVTGGKATDLTVLFGAAEFAAGQGHTVSASPASYTEIGQIIRSQTEINPAGTSEGRTVLRAHYLIGATAPGGTYNWNGTETAPVTMAITLRSHG